MYEYDLFRFHIVYFSSYNITNSTIYLKSHIVEFMAHIKCPQICTVLYPNGTHKVPVYSRSAHVGMDV
jgi:hypothetical protein